MCWRSHSGPVEIQVTALTGIIVFRHKIYFSLEINSMQRKHFILLSFMPDTAQLSSTYNSKQLITDVIYYAKWYKSMSSGGNVSLLVLNFVYTVCELLQVRHPRSKSSFKKVFRGFQMQEPLIVSVITVMSHSSWIIQTNEILLKVALTLTNCLALCLSAMHSS